MKQALEALELLAKYENPSTKIQVRKPKDGGPIVTMYPHKVATEAAALLRDRLAQPEQEPVAWANSFDLQNFDMKVRTGPDLHHTVPLYTAPPKRELTCVCGAVWEGETMVHSPREREWVGLTDGEHDSIKRNYHDMTWTLEMFARAIEQALKEKNT
jgi:hypothetical protein